MILAMSSFQRINPEDEEILVEADFLYNNVVHEDRRFWLTRACMLFEHPRFLPLLLRRTHNENIKPERILAMPIAKSSILLKFEMDMVKQSKRSQIRFQEFESLV